jgi:hypothetical protein
MLWLRVICCQSCGLWFGLCSSCDRGQRYCSDQCSEQARRISLKAAGAKYQRTERGRECHAERQRRYRARQRAAERVTHQGCSASEESSAIVERARDELCAVGAGGIRQVAYATMADNLVAKEPAGVQGARYASASELLGAPGGIRCAGCGRTGVLLRDPRATLHV